MSKFLDVSSAIERRDSEGSASAITDDKVAYEIKPGGSGRGINFYLSYSQCPRRTRLDIQNRRPDNIVTGQAGSGTIFHALQDIYHSRPKDALKLGMGDIEFTGAMVEEDCLLEGWRLHEWYRDRYPPDAFGDVVYTERRYPETDDEAQLMRDTGFEYCGPGQSTLEVPTITAQVDLTTYASKDHVDWWDMAWGIKAEPGYYILDWKTDSSERQTLTDEYTYTLQLPWYQMVFEALHDIELKGCIAAVMIKKKIPVFRPILLKPIDDERRAAVRTFLKHCHDQITGPNPDWANPNACFAFFRMCRHLAEGRCAQY